MIFQYESGMPLHLGVGWDPQNPESNKLIMGYLRPAEPSTKTPAATDNFSTSFIDNFSQLEETMSRSLDVSGKGKVGVFKAEGKASYSSTRAHFRSNSNVVWAISGKRTYDVVSAFGLEITERGQELIDEISQSGDFEGMQRKIGSHIVTSLTKEAEIHVLYIFTASDTSKMEQIKSAISAAASYGSASGQASVSIFKEVKKKDSNVQFSVKVLHRGIDDEDDSLSQLVAEAPGDIVKARQLMSSAISQISWEDAPIKEFAAEPLASIFPLPHPDYDVDLLMSRVSRMRTTQSRIVDRYLELDDLIERDARSNIELKTGAIAAIREEMEYLDDRFLEIDGTIKGILQTPKEFTQYPDVSISSGRLHWITLDFGAFLSWESEVTGNTYNNHSERIQGKVTFWPKFLIKNPDLIKRFELKRNNSVLFSISTGELNGKLHSGNFDTYELFKSTHQVNEYCWRGNWGEVCAPRAQNTSWYKNHTKQNEKSYSYQFVIVDAENNVHSFPFNNASIQAF
ncbi:hypothetical protein A6F57_05625 [Alteromonas stellipolaris]|uniref:hypothetical protein n=1 Tax=Alteromonas stellipolaris TaxID=233316 RepID=UPI0007B45848|nr:hypothetical protein [Alteromonas stellipolaris]ANB24735.1 hypothetical protein A6F57_05625 [Alteromonas stellipolaris]